MLKRLTKRLTTQQQVRRTERRTRRADAELEGPVRFMAVGRGKPHKGRSRPRHQGEQECARRRRQLARGQIQAAA